MSDAGRRNLARVDAWLAQLAAETDRARHSAEFTAYVQAMARFHHYSWSNVALIRLARPTATRVGGRTTLWEPLGYRVRKAEWHNPIWIVRPKKQLIDDEATGEKREIIVDWVCCKVYDIEQVEPDPGAKPLDAPWQTITGDYAALYHLLLRVCRRLQVTVTLRGDLPRDTKGQSDGQGHITLNSTATEGERVHILAHELAHEVLHPRAPGVVFSRDEVECQAEGTAYVVLSSLGIAMPNSPTYLALYGIGTDHLRRNAEAIHAGVKRILSEIEAVQAVSPRTVEQDEEVRSVA